MSRAERVKELTAGIAAEIRSELAAGQHDESGDDGPARLAANFDQIKESLDRLQDALPFASDRRIAEPSLLDHVVSEAKPLTPEARELLFTIRRSHLTRDEYRKLLRSPLRDALRMLRTVGLLVPRAGAEEGQDVVYYYPSGVYQVIEVAQKLLPPTPPEVRETVARELRNVGYARRTED